MPRVEAEVGSAASSYEILAKLATGGMAEIFLARGASVAGVERYVVLKRILRHRASDAAFVRMFLDEARLAALLQHPNIAQVYDIGKLGDSYFFTMEYVHGETVRAVLQRSHGLRTPIPFQSVLVIAAGAAAGLHHAHDRNGYDGKPLGIVHRDVSPSNLMVSYEGTVKVVDFGVAKAAHRSQETRSGAVKGKISYLSPEQCRGGAVDRRSDLFSLGIVMWEMLTTERLYKRGTDFEAMAAIVSEEVPPPSARRSDVPRELDGIVLKLLAKDPAHRYQTAAELQEDLENVAVRLGSALSSAALARFLRDLFGQRPEPWVEMQSREAHPEAFTVTSEPIPADLAIPVADDMDLKLGGVPDLSEQRVRLPTDGPATKPFRLSESESSGHERPPLPAGLVTSPTANLRIPDGPTTLPFTREPRPASTTGSSPNVMAPNVTAPSGPHPMSASSSGPHAAPATNAPSASYPSLASYPAYAPPPTDDAPAARKVPAIVIVLVAAVAVGIALGIVFALRGGGTPGAGKNDVAQAGSSSSDDPTAGTGDTHAGSPATDTHAGSGDVQAGAPGSDTHAGSGDTQAGTGDTHAGTNDTHGGTGDTHAGSGDTQAGTSDTHAVTGDTHAGSPATDTHAGAGDTHAGSPASNMHGGTGDAQAGSPASNMHGDTHAGSAADMHGGTGDTHAGSATDMHGGTGDTHAGSDTHTDRHANGAGAAHATTAHAGTDDAHHVTNDTSHKAGTDARKPAPAEELAKQYAASRYADAVATCVANPALVTTSVTACVSSACHVHDAARAKKWLAGAGPKKTATLVAACKAAGTNLEPAAATARPKDDCAADPMACQH